MAAPTNYFVRPVTGNDTTGDGLSHATAWKTSAKAEATIVRDAVNGDQVNMNDEGDDVLSAAMTFANYGNASTGAPLIFKGYTLVPNDGGVGGLSGGGSVGIANKNSQDVTGFIDMHLHDCGAANIVDLDNNCFATNCEIDDTSGNGFQADNDLILVGCHLHNIGGNPINGIGTGAVYRCAIIDGANTAGTAIQNVGHALHNIIHLNSTGGKGVNCSDGSIVIHNSIFNEAAGTQAGIMATGNFLGIVMNNIVEGFSGVGGVGIDYSTICPYAAGGNAGFNNTTNFVTNDFLAKDYGDDEALAASAFVDAINNDFNLVDAGNLSAGALPATDKGSIATFLGQKGAIALVSAAGGGAGVSRGFSRGFA